MLPGFQTWPSSVCGRKKVKETCQPSWLHQHRHYPALSYSLPRPSIIILRTSPSISRSEFWCCLSSFAPLSDRAGQQNSPQQPRKLAAWPPFLSVCFARPPASLSLSTFAKPSLSRQLPISFFSLHLLWPLAWAGFLPGAADAKKKLKSFEKSRVLRAMSSLDVLDNISHYQRIGCGLQNSICFFLYSTRACPIDFYGESCCRFV